MKLGAILLLVLLTGGVTASATQYPTIKTKRLFKPMENTSKLILLALLMLLPGIASAQYVTVIGTNTVPVNITIATNQVMQVLNFTGESSGYLNITKDGITQRAAQALQSLDSSAISRTPVVVGPATVSIACAGDGGRICLTYKLFDNPTAAGSSLPSNTVVIPADATGNVDIILESSTDLVTWTAASPGSYGASTSKRFFRVRAVAQ